MAAKKTKELGAEKAEGAKKVDPFKTKKTKAAPAKTADTVTPPADVAEAIDLFRENQEQARHFEGEATVYKDKVQTYCQGEYTRRLLSGVPGSFKVLGDETMVTYIVSDSSAGLSEEDLEAFTDKWGEDAAKELITRDFHSIRFDPDVLAANYDTVVEALQGLPGDILERLFKPMLMKASPGAVQAAKRYAKGADELQDLIKDLRIKNYIK